MGYAKGTRWTKETVVNFVNNESKYVLLEFLEENVGCSKKIKIKDDIGYLYKTSVDGIKKSQKRTDTLVRFYRNNPYTDDNIITWMNENNINYKILKFAKDSRQDLYFECRECGCKFHFNWTELFCGQRCPTCTMNEFKERNRHSVSKIVNDIEDWFGDKGLKFKSPEKYRTVDQKMILTDLTGYRYYTSYNLIKGAHERFGYLHKTHGNPYACYNISIWLKNNCPELKLNTSNYDESGFVFVKCEEHGHISRIHLSKLYERKRCPTCNRKRHIDLDVVVDEFSEVGYVVDKDKTEYNGNGSTIYFYCPVHGEESLIYGNFTQGARCISCAYDRISGSNNHMWKHEKTDEERRLQRKYRGYLEWRKEVYKRDNYTCQKCDSSKSNYLNAHHKDGYHWCKERRLDVANGVTLCLECHASFHSIYGNKNNTEQQYLEWINNN